MYHITAKDILWATAGKRVDHDLLYLNLQDQAPVVKKAQYLKITALEHTWITGIVPYKLPLQLAAQNCGELLPKVLKQLWIDGFDLSIRKERNQRTYRVFFGFLIPIPWDKEWMLTLTAASSTPRDEADYIPVSIPR